MGVSPLGGMMQRGGMAQGQPRQTQSVVIKECPDELAHQRQTDPRLLTETDAVGEAELSRKLGKAAAFADCPFFFFSLNQVCLVESHESLSG